MTMETQNTHLPPTNASSFQTGQVSDVHPEDVRWPIYKGDKLVGSYSIRERKAVVAERRAKIERDRAERGAMFTGIEREFSAMHKGPDGNRWLWVRPIRDRFKEGLRNIKAIPGRRFDPRTKLWAVPYDAFDQRQGDWSGTIDQAYPSQIYHTYGCNAYYGYVGNPCTMDCRKHHGK